jgi:hypothetical protein
LCGIRLAADSCSTLHFGILSRIDKQVGARRFQMQQAGVWDAAMLAKLRDGLPRDLPELGRPNVSAKRMNQSFGFVDSYAHNRIEPQFKQQRNLS